MPADARDRATEDCDAYARRSLRISRSLHGIAEITGRLHSEVFVTQVEVPVG